MARYHPFGIGEKKIEELSPKKAISSKTSKTAQISTFDPTIYSYLLIQNQCIQHIEHRLFILNISVDEIHELHFAETSC